MIRTVLITTAILFSFQLHGQKNAAAATATFEQPKLVVGIVVDQMRADYIYRYWDNLAPDGFKRLIAEGFECSNTQYNYMPTYTGPGHASIYTGTTPSMHGIIGNNWYEDREGVIYCASDSTVQSVGGEGRAGQMSPRRLLTTTISDELRLFSNFRSKVVGISMKDRGAIFPAGHSGQAYWFDNAAGSFITSSYYAAKETGLPAWLVSFNAKRLADKYLNGKWSPMYPVVRYGQSTADNTMYENILDADPDALPVFDYDLKKISLTEKDLLRKTPFGNSLTKEMALAALEGEQLGRDTICDMLLVSFSSTDYIGHAFGTNAIETEDTYLRLDKDIAELVSYLDREIGRENFLLFLTSDHGAVPNPVFMNDNKLPGGYIYADTITNTVKGFFKSQYNDTALFVSYLNDQIWINDMAIKKSGVAKKALMEELSTELLKKPYVADVITGEQLSLFSCTTGMHALIQNGYNRKRSGDIAIIYQSGYIESYGQRRPHAGTTHGSPYRYDTHVPLYWLGWNIKKGRTVREIAITDIAATLSSLLNICQPSGSTGHPIEELME